MKIPVWLFSLLVLFAMGEAIIITHYHHIVLEYNMVVRRSLETNSSLLDTNAGLLDSNQKCKEHLDLLNNILETRLAQR